MIDIEKTKSLIQVEWDKYRIAIEKTQSPTVWNDENLHRYYLDRARKYKFRAQGMEDLLYSLGYLVLHRSDGTFIDVVECVDSDCSDEIPF